MLRLLSSFILVLFSLLSSAQFTVHGRLTGPGERPVEFATITASRDSQQVAATLADSTGAYTFRLPAGSYTVSVSRMSYKPLNQVITLTSDTSLVFILEAADAGLTGVTVSTRKPLLEKKVDRLVFNVENSIAAGGSDAYDLLQKTPGVSVQNGSVNLVGKSSVSFMINDRALLLSGPDIVNLLKTISSEDIARIEVITNPSARYDAQGNSGIINIILKKNARLGYNGLLRFAENQTTYPFYFVGGNVNYNKGRFKTFAVLTRGYGASKPIDKNVINYAQQKWMTEIDGKYDQNFTNAQLGIDYQVSNQTLVGIVYNGSWSDPNSRSTTRANVFNNANTLDSTLFTTARGINGNNFSTVNAHLVQSFGSKGVKMSADMDWYTNNDDNNRTIDNTNYLASGQPTGYATRLLSTSLQGIDIYTLKTDIDIPKKTYTLRVGAKLSSVRNTSDVQNYRWMNNKYDLDSLQSNRFNYRENIQAAYVEYSRTIHKVDIQAGIRSEYTQTLAHSANLDQKNSNSYVKAFPTLAITYNKDDNNIFSFAYGKRINRPDYYLLNPFRWYDNPYSYSEGNPFLQPSYTNNIEISHTYKGVLVNALSFSNTNNYYDQVTFVNNASNIQRIYPLNFITTYSYNYSGTYSNNTLPWLEHSSSLDIYYTIIRSKIPETVRRQAGMGAYFSTDNQVILNKRKTMKLAVNGAYQFPYILGIDKSDAFFHIDMALRYTPQQSHFQFILSSTDILRTSERTLTSITNGVKQSYSYMQDNTRIKLLIRYKFGNDKIKHEERETGNSDEKSRVR